MTKEKAIEEATAYKKETRDNAYVIKHDGGDFDWYCRHFFDNGFEGGYVVWSTENVD